MASAELRTHLLILTNDDGGDICEVVFTRSPFKLAHEGNQMLVKIVNQILKTDYPASMYSVAAFHVDDAQVHDVTELPE